MTAAAVRKTQRLVFGEELVRLGAEDPRIVVFDADVSSSTQTRLFAEAFPQRFFNFGIAEGNMVSAAAGLSTVGFVPLVSSFALFLSLRAGEQVRAQIAATNLNVKLIGSYAGLSDYADGASHQSVEDMAAMRVMPNMTIIAPSDAAQTRAALRAALKHEGPVFLRLSREAVAESLSPGAPFRIGEGVSLREGTDVALIAIGTMLEVTLEAAQQLEAEGIATAVINLHTLKPLDEELIVAAARKTGVVITVEEHSIIGGLGSAVCETLCRHYPVPVLRCGIPDRLGESGAYPEILARAGLDVRSICLAAHEGLKTKATV
jgi:transketolase